MLALWVKMSNGLWNLKNREEGQGMVEYGLIIALVAIGLIVVMGTMRGQLDATFQKIADKLTAANATAP